MKNKVLAHVFLLIASVLLLTQCRREKEYVYPIKLQFVTEEYKPLNYVENGILTGLGPEVLKQICQQLKIPFDTKVLVWEDAYTLLQNSDNTVLYSTVLNAERKDLFKWAGPFGTLDWMFYASSQNPILLNSLSDAKNVAGIGVIHDHAIEQYLVSEGFTNLIYCTDNKEAFSKLLNGEITLFPSDKLAAEAALNSIGKSIYDITSKLLIRTDMVYFAFSKNIPDAVVADFQREIDALKTNGALKALYQQFMQSAEAPEILQIYTEQYPPLTFRNNFGEISGFGTDIVNEIMKRNRAFYKINLALWSIGYDLALNNPNFCLFTMDRTELRENLFNWVGPIGTNTTYFYIRTGSPIAINSLDDAKSLPSVGTVSSWFSDQYLRDQGFTNLVSDSDPAVMAQKLLSGEIDAFVCSSVSFPDILEALGHDYSEVDPEFEIMSSDYYIAFSKNTSAATVTQWQSALDAAKQDGTYENIYKKWFD